MEYSREKMVEKVLQEAYPFDEYGNRSLEYGARPIKHCIEKKIGTLVARGIVSQFLYPGGNYLLDIEKETNEIKLTTLSLLESRKNLLK